MGGSSTFKICINILAHINCANGLQGSHAYLQIDLQKKCYPLFLTQLVNFIVFQSVIVTKGQSHHSSVKDFFKSLFNTIVTNISNILWKLNLEKSDFIQTEHFKLQEKLIRDSGIMEYTSTSIFALTDPQRFSQISFRFTSVNERVLGYTCMF